MFGSGELAHSFHLGVLAVSASVILGCAAQGHDYPEFRSELADLKIRTAPAGSRITETSAIRPSPAALEATWIIDTRMEWNKYKAWLTEAMPGWKAPGPNAALDDKLIFSRTLLNELFFLQTQRIAGPEPTLVRVSFRVVAD